MRDYGNEPGVIDCFEENRTAYIVMDDAGGETLTEYTKTHEKMTAEQLMRRLLPVMETLKKLHEGNILYENICPSNIVVTEKGSFKLLGVPKDDRDYSYLPAEQCGSCQTPGPWSDIYSLCALIYEYLTGRTPPEALVRMLFDEWKKPSELGISIDPALERILEKGLKPDAEERYRSMEELTEDVMSWLPEIPEKRRISEKITAVCAFFCLFAVLNISGVSYYKSNIEKFKFRGIKTETVVLVPKEEMTAEECDDALSVIYERTESFSGKDRYVIKEKENRIEIITPLSVYRDEDVETVINREVLGSSSSIQNEFLVYYEIPVVWEEETVMEGQFQCRQEEIPEPSVCVEYSCLNNYTYKDIAQQRGAWYHVMYDFKRELDVLNIPYAFGVSPDNKKSVVIKTAQKDMSKLLANAIGAFNLILEDEKQNRYILYGESRDIINSSGGTYSLEIQMNEYSQDDFQEYITECREQDSKKLYLILKSSGFYTNEYRVAECSLEENLKENLKEGSIIFPGCTLGKTDIFTEETLPFLNLLKVKSEISDKSEYYYLRGMQYCSEDAYVDTKTTEENEYLKGTADYL